MENINYDKDDENLKSNVKIMNHEIKYSDIKNTKFNMGQSINSNDNRQNNPDNNNNNAQTENIINQFDIVKNINNDKSTKLNNQLKNQNNEIIQENIYQNNSNNKENENKNVGTNNIKKNENEDNNNKKKYISKTKSTKSFKSIIPKANSIKNKAFKDKKIKLNNIPINPIKSGKDKTNFNSYTTRTLKKTVEKPKNRIVLGKRNNSLKNIYVNNVFDNYYPNNNNNSHNISANKSRENSSNTKKEIKYEYQHQNVGEIFSFGVQQFKPKKRKSKPAEPLFSQYEMSGVQNTYPSKKNNSLTKNHQKIFTIEMNDILPTYKATTYASIANNYIKMKNDENKFKINYDKKNYYSYANNIKRENPFEGPSQYEKKPKERKNFIAKQVKKGESEFYDITQFEDMIYSKVEIKEEELNQLIIRFIDILYKDVDKILNNKDGFKSYNYKINRIANMIIFMKNVDQIKIMEALKRTADSYNKMEIFKKLNNEIDEINKFRKTKGYKHERISNSKEGYSNRYKITRTIQNSLK